MEIIFPDTSVLTTDKKAIIPELCLAKEGV